MLAYACVREFLCSFVCICVCVGVGGGGVRGGMRPLNLMTYLI